MRGCSGFGPLPIGPRDIDPWARLTGASPTPWEVKLIIRIDQAWLQEQAEESERKRKKGGKKKG